MRQTKNFSQCGLNEMGAVVIEEELHVKKEKWFVKTCNGIVILRGQGCFHFVKAFPLEKLKENLTSVQQTKNLGLF